LLSISQKNRLLRIIMKRYPLKGYLFLFLHFNATGND
jgi:hypothetical protein